ncbi:MAG: translation initiation factor IF-2 [Candidatus Omnitrophota bacterium]|nr:translation initiation factor IF-2 [Candidatus Omnitrophota bacterium]
MMLKKSVKKKVTAKKETKPKKLAAKAKPTAKKTKVKAVVKAKIKKISAVKVKPVEKKVKLAVAPAPPIKPVIAPKVETPPAKEVPRPPFREAPKAVAAKEPVVLQKPAATVPVKEAPKPAAPPTAPEVTKPAPQPLLREIELELPITVKDLAVRLQEKSSVIIKILMGSGEMVGINQPLSETQAEKICLKYGCKIKRAPEKEEVILGIHREEDKPQDLKHRSPVVTFMGHVDHGKTSLLDAIRKTKVAESEHGGITQHIGAYRVVLPGGEITFLDTPGHEAFTAMRARGARITDIVVLVVAADDGVMPQTQEAIDHARAAEVPIIVAMNKIDRQQANADRVKKQLSELGLAAEDWGGKTITVPVSAKTGQGIDNLLEMILLEAQMLELKSNPHRLARGVVIEAKMAKGRGPVVTLLVENGTLRLNENIIVGNFYGKIRAMFNDRGASVVSAGPSVPVEVLGISGIPEAGEQFFAIAEEKEAKELAQARMEKERQAQVKEVKRVSLEDLHAQIIAGKIKDLKLIIKADVQGSLEAIKNTLEKLNVSEIKLNIIHAGVGNINNSDAVLAIASDALILGFNVDCDGLAKETADKEGLDVRIYNIIYELANDIKAAVEGMLEPKIKKVFLGKAEVRKVFKLSRAGIIAGCFVTKGKFNRSAVVNLVRNGEVVFEGKLASLKRFKDDVRDVAEGFECGMAIAGFDQLQEGDVIEGYEIEKIARKL